MSRKPSCTQRSHWVANPTQPINSRFNTRDVQVRTTTDSTACLIAPIIRERKRRTMRTQWSARKNVESSQRIIVPYPTRTQAYGTIPCIFWLETVHKQGAQFSGQTLLLRYKEPAQRDVRHAVAQNHCKHVHHRQAEYGCEQHVGLVQEREGCRGKYQIQWYWQSNTKGSSTYSCTPVR
jgi:hypothetical protein